MRTTIFAQSAGYFGKVLVMACLCSATGFGADFKIKVVEFPEVVLPGMVFDVRAEIQNVSGHPITFPRRDDIQVEVRNADGARVAPCIDSNDDFEPLPADWKGRVLEADWTKNQRWVFCFERPGTISSRFFISSSGPYHNHSGEVFEAWEGEVSTPVMEIDVRPPQGVDRAVFEAYGPSFLTIIEHSSELLQRFPTSTYAAYLIWQKYAEGSSQVETDRAVAALESPYPFRTVLAPCDANGVPAGEQATRFGPQGLFRCRVAWLELILSHHLRVWFADEVRLRLALDRYWLDDKAACAAGLESLSEHAKPYVAEKARALLEAMQAKNMLPGGPKDLTATPAETEPEGKTAQ